MALNGWLDTFEAAIDWKFSLSQRLALQLTSHVARVALSATFTCEIAGFTLRLCKPDTDNSQHAFEILMNHRRRCWKANKFHALQMIKRGWKTEEMNFLALPTNSPVIKRIRKIFCNPTISLSNCFAFSKLNSWIFIQIYPFLGEVFLGNLNNDLNIKMPRVSMLFAPFTRSLTK